MPLKPVNSKATRPASGDHQPCSSGSLIFQLSVKFKYVLNEQKAVFMEAVR